MFVPPRWLLPPLFSGLWPWSELVTLDVFTSSAHSRSTTTSSNGVSGSSFSVGFVRFEVLPSPVLSSMADEDEGAVPEPILRRKRSQYVWSPLARALSTIRVLFFRREEGGEVTR